MYSGKPLTNVQLESDKYPTTVKWITKSMFLEKGNFYRRLENFQTTMLQWLGFSPETQLILLENGEFNGGCDSFQTSTFSTRMGQDWLPSQPFKKIEDVRI